MPHFELAARTSYDFEFAPNRDLGHSMQTEALPGDILWIDRDSQEDLVGT